MWCAVVAAEESAVAGEPGRAAFDHPPVPAESVGRVDAPACDPGGDTSLGQPAAQVGAVVGLVRVQPHRPAMAWPAAGTDRGDPADQRDQRLAVVGVGRADPGDQRQPGAVGQQVDLRSGFTPVDRVWPGQIPPFSARTLIESTTAVDQSTSLAWPSSSRTTRGNLAHTPARVHWQNLRCTVGVARSNTEATCRQEHPETQTNTIAANTTRSSTRRRPPPWGRAGGSGSNGATSSHNGSGIRRFTSDTTRSTTTHTNRHAKRDTLLGNDQIMRSFGIEVFAKA